MLISVLIINYNSGDRLKRCLEHLAAQTLADFEAIVVDNASTDGSEKTLLPDARFQLIMAGKNLGFAPGNNLAAQSAKGSWLALLNPDAYAKPDWLASLMDATKRHSDCALFGSTQINYKNPSILDGCGDCYNFAGFPWRGGIGHPLSHLPSEGSVFAPCAAASLYRADLFHQLGGFDERYFCYCEDVDLAFRARLIGHYTIQVEKAVVYHEGSAITGVSSPFSVFHGTRNRIWTYLKNMPVLLLWAFLPLHVLGNLLLMLHRPTFPARWKGTIAAFKGMPDILKSRREVQSTRSVSAIQFAKSLSWSLPKMMKRAGDVRPL